MQFANDHDQYMVPSYRLPLDLLSRLANSRERVYRPVTLSPDRLLLLIQELMLVIFLFSASCLLENSHFDDYINL